MASLRTIQKNTLLISSFLCLLLAYSNCSPGGFKIDESATSLSSEAFGQGKGNPFICSDRNQVSVTPLRRLTQEEYSNTLLALLGSSLHTQLQADISTLPSDQLMKSVSDFTASIIDSQMEAYNRIAEKSFQLISSNAANAQRLGGTCITAATVTAACRDQAIQKLGQLAFRRPLTAAELTKYREKVFALGASGAESLGLVVYTLMQSPDFLLHLELGSASDSNSGNSFDLTAYEIASRLSYFLWSAPPDETLYQAAASDSLKDPAAVSAQVERMLSDPRAQAKLNSFFRFWLDPKKYSAQSFSSKFLSGLDVNAVNAEFEREMFEFINHIVWQEKGSFKDLLTSNLSFAKTSQVAGIYGHSPVTNPSAPAVMAGRRKGVLMRGPVLATEGNETHPILRGAKFNNRILCRSLGLPSGVMTNDPKFFSDEARIMASTRERTRGLTASSTCMGCHSQINPFGFAFENFDGLGRFRSQEQVFSQAGEMVATHPVVTHVSGLRPSFVMQAEAEDGYDVIDRLLDGSEAPACFVQQITRYYRIRAEKPEDNCLLADMYDHLQTEEGSEASILESVKSFLTHQSLSRRRFQ